jgi:hypothetical protein
MLRNLFAITVAAVYAAGISASSRAETFIYAKPITGGAVLTANWTQREPPPDFLSLTGLLPTQSEIVNGRLTSSSQTPHLIGTWLNGWMLTNWSTLATRYAGLAGNRDSLPDGFFFQFPVWAQSQPFLPEQVAAITPMGGEFGPNSVFRIDTFQSSVEWADRIPPELAGGFFVAVLSSLLFRIRFKPGATPAQKALRKSKVNRRVLQSCRRVVV